MALTQEELKKIREAITGCARPVILFDDDQDGLSSFLMVYACVKEGKGIPIKNAPDISEYARGVNDYSPDLVILLDIPMVSQDFIDSVHARIIWVDHHPITERRNIECFNPRLHDPEDNMPTSYWIYKAIGEKENLWIAMCGIVGDWFFPDKDTLDEFRKKYPDLLPERMKKPEEALHESELGRLSRVMAFNLKGKAAEVMKSVKAFTRIKTPYEILNQETAGGKFIYKKFEVLDREFQELLKQAEEKADPKDKMLLFTYKSMACSFSTELSNALDYSHPEKLVLVAWEYNGEYKCSLRSTTHDLPKMIEKALDGVSGYGGGHMHACGSNIKKEHFERFVEDIRKQL